MPATGDTLTMDDYKRIIKIVIENSDKESWWYNWSKLTAYSHLFRASYVDADGQTKLSSEPYRMATDEQVQKLCEKAVNEAEEHADNLREYVSGLEAEVENGRQLEKEYNEIANSGPMGAGLIQRLNEWKAKHDGFTPYRLHEAEFILGYLKGLLKQTGEQEDTPTILNIPQNVLEMFEVPLERGSLRISDNPIDGRYRFILRVSQSMFMTDWNANRKSTLPPTKTICEWVYWQDKSGNIVPVKKETIDNYRIKNKE